MGLLDGKVAVITGAGNGIGRAHALLFASEGASVVVNDIGGARDGVGSDEAAADRVVAEIRAAGGTAVPNYDDVSARAGAENLVATAVDQLGKLDILVNNAGILRDKTLLKMTDDMWDLVVRVHLRGTYLCTQAACRHLRERNDGEGGRIINTTSVSGMMGNFGQANYAAAKAGIYGFTRVAALEMQKYKVTVNALAPVALTRMTDDLPMMKSMPDADALLSPDHIAPAALYLASDLAADVTGVVLAVEGSRLSLFKVIQTQAVPLPAGDQNHWTAEQIAAHWSDIVGLPPTTS